MQASSSLSLFQNRLTLCLKERSDELDKVKDLDSVVKKMFTNMPKRPDGPNSSKGADAQMKALEFKRSTTSMTLKEETILLNEIKKISKSTTLQQSFADYNTKINSLKKERSDLRYSARIKDSSISELQAGITKLNLCVALECTPSELTSQIIPVKKDYLKLIIGKQGSIVKALESTHVVSIDVSSESLSVKITGKLTSIAACIADLENITKAENVEHTITNAVSAVLLNNKAALYNTITKQYEHLRVNLKKGEKTIFINGKPDQIESFITKINELKVIESSLSLTKNEVGFIVGKGGAKVKEIESKYDVLIEVAKDSSIKTIDNFTIIGDDVNVSKCKDEIVQMLKDAEVNQITIDASARHRALFKDNKAKVLNDVQAETGASVTFHGGEDRSRKKSKINDDKAKDDKDKDKVIEKTSICIKGTNAQISNAQASLLQTMLTFDSTITSIPVSLEVLPFIIGKGGDIIKALRKSTGVSIDIDHGDSSITIICSDEAKVAAAKDAINELVEANNIRIVVVGKALIPHFLGSSGKAIRTQIDEIGCKFDIVQDANSYSKDKQASRENVKLRGTKVQVDEAVTLIDAFVASNHTVEHVIAADDFRLVLTDGRSENSILKKLQSRYAQVDVVLMHKKSSLRLRGTKADVEGAVFFLNVQLNGGDGITVTDVRVPSEARGSVIGSKGENIKKIESDFSVTVQVLSSPADVFRVRGEASDVSNAAAFILVFIATIKITVVVELSNLSVPASPPAPSIPITATGAGPRQIAAAAQAALDADKIAMEAYDNAVKARAEEAKRNEKFFVKGGSNNGSNSNSKLSKLLSDLDVRFEVKKGQVKLRGSSSDLDEAKRFINEYIFNIAEVIIDVDKAHMKAVGGLSSPHWKRIVDSHKVKIAINKNAIVLTGSSCEQVRKATGEAYAYLDFALPSHYACVNVTPSIMNKIGSPSNLATVGNETETVVKVDGICGCIRVRIRFGADTNSDTAKKVEKAVTAVKSLITAWSANTETVVIDKWLVGFIVGKGGDNINKISKETSTKIDIDEDQSSSSSSVTVSGGSEGMNVKAKEMIISLIEKTKKEMCNIDLPPNSSSLFIGKGGKNIKMLQEKSGATFDMMKEAGGKSNVVNAVRIKGKEEQIILAKALVEEFIVAFEKENSYEEIAVENERFFAAVVGKGGEKINLIQNECKVRLLVDREGSKVSCKGGGEGVKKAIEMVKVVLNEERAKLARFREKEEEEEEGRNKRAREQEEKENGGGSNGDGSGSGKASGGKPPVEKEVLAKLPYAVVPVGSSPSAYAPVLSKGEKKRLNKAKAKVKEESLSRAEYEKDIENEGKDLLMSLENVRDKEEVAEVVQAVEALEAASRSRPLSPVLSVASDASLENEDDGEDDYFVSSSGFSVRL